MRILLLLTALFLVLPVAVDAAIIIQHPSMRVDVTVSVAGTVLLASGPFVIDDMFLLHGTGSADFRAPEPGEPSTILRLVDVGFGASSGGVSANGEVFLIESRVLEDTREASLHLSTPRYQLDFFPGDPFSILVGVDGGGARFSAQSNGALVQVGGESEGLIGTASFDGTGRVVPEPASAMLLTLAALGVATLGRRLGPKRSSTCSGAR